MGNCSAEKEWRAGDLDRGLGGICVRTARRKKAASPGSRTWAQRTSRRCMSRRGPQRGNRRVRASASTETDIPGDDVVPDAGNDEARERRPIIFACRGAGARGVVDVESTCR
jgi:hypothetical protein